MCCWAASPSASAAETATVAVASDYDFRGDTQTNHAPVAQLTFEWSGLDDGKVGLFASDVNFGTVPSVGNPQLELAPYFELSAKVTPELKLNGGAAYYTYVIGGGGRYDFGEIYLAVDYLRVRGSLYYTPNYDGSATPRQVAAEYIAIDGTTELADRWSLLEHAGYAWGDYWTEIGGGRKLDVSLGLTHHLGKVDLALLFIDKRQVSAGPAHQSDTTGRVVFSLSRTFSL